MDNELIVEEYPNDPDILCIVIYHKNKEDWNHEEGENEEQ